MDAFAEKLKAAMDKAQMRQVDLVAKSGLSKGMVSMYVSGTCEPTSESLEKLALALGVTMEYFTGGAPLAEKPLPKRLKRISPRMAAQVLGTGTRYIEDGLKQGRLPFGSAVAPEEGHGEWRYHISPYLFRAYVGDEAFTAYFGEGA